MTQQHELTFIDELTELFKQPKTLRSMKYTNWSNTTDRKEYGLDCFHVGTKTQNEEEYSELIKKLGKCVSEGGNMSEDLLAEFVFSGEYGELLYDEKNKNGDKDIKKMNMLFEKVLLCKIRKTTIDYNYDNKKKLVDTDNMGNVWYSKCKTKEENEEYHRRDLIGMKSRSEECENEIKISIEEYEKIQKIIIERYGIKSMTFEEREKAEIKYVSWRTYFLTGYYILISKSNFTKLIKSLSVKKRFLRVGEQSVIDLYFKHTVGEEEMVIKTAPYHKDGLRLKSLITRENVFSVKGVILENITRKDDNTLYLPKMFNIISKREKLYTEGIKGIKDNKDNANKAFEPYEKTGIEILYVRLGYKSDGTKQGNRNKGNLECLKNAYKENMCGHEWSEKKNEYVKIKGLKMPTKKDELTKVLYKL